MSVCVACGADNREGRKFCGRCGIALGITCSACGTANHLDELFCGDCGAPLAQVPGSAEASPTVPVAGEKKQITVLFADVAGSMDLQEGLDAEVWAAIMGRFVSILAEGVRKFGGTVDKFTGDGIMALFGAPVAQEDHARRACHAAWHLTKAIGEYSEELREEHDVELRVRIGLNSGEVVVGRVGDDVTLDPTALGHTVGLAQRMEAMAEPGKAYLTQYTARLVDDSFALHDFGLQPVKGVHTLIRVYGLGPPVSRPHRALGAAPLVGRDRELTALEDALAMAMEGHAQVVGIVGEAGVGKSRLCEEFAQIAVSRDSAVRRATGVSHGREVPFLPILALLRDYFAVTEADDAASAREKISNRVLGLDPDADGILPLLFDFLEVPDPARPAAPMGPEMRMRRLFDALRRLTQRRSQREMVLLLVEDLHWFDPQSVNFLERLIESFPGSRTLVVANFRPEFSARWMRHSYYRQLPLAPLQATAVGELLGGLLGMDPSLIPLLTFVQERTGGNPFFVEELVRAFVEDGTLAGEPGRYRLTRPLHEVDVSPNVQAVIAARIDRLQPEHKTVLQTAAVIGRTFDTEMLARVTGWDGDVLDDALCALCAAELLQEVGNDGSVEYRFWHPLTQQVAYGSVLSDRRRRLHAAVAEGLIAKDSDRLDESAAVLAWHWERAAQPLEAAAWNVRAGEWVMFKDLEEATRRWRAAIQLLTEAQKSRDALELAVRTRIRLVQLGARTGIAPEESEHLFAEGQAMAELLGDAGLLATTIWASGTPHVLSGDFREAQSRYLEATRLAEKVADRDLLGVTCLGLALIPSYTGPITEGLIWADQILTLCGGDAEVGTGILRYSLLNRALQFKAWALALAGRLPDANTALAESLALSRTRSEPECLVWGLAIAPQLAWLAGGSGDLVATASEAVTIAHDSGNVAFLVPALEGVSMAHLLAGDVDQAVVVCQRALAETDEHRSGRFQQGKVLVQLARSQLAAEHLEDAMCAAEQAVSVARTQEARVVECLGLLTLGQVCRISRRTSDAKAALKAALILAKETAALTYEPFIREELGWLLGDYGEIDQALALYSNIGASGHFRRLEAERSMRATP